MDVSCPRIWMLPWKYTVGSRMFCQGVSAQTARCGGGWWRLSWVLKNGEEVWGKAILSRGISNYESAHRNGSRGWNIKTSVGGENGDTADGQTAKSTVNRLRSFCSILECGPIQAAGVTAGRKVGLVGCGRNIRTFTYLASSHPFIFILIQVL